MKRTIIISICLFLLTGCFSQKNNLDKDNKRHVFKMYETIKTSDFKVKVVSKNATKTISDYNGFMEYTADGIYLNIKINVENISKESKTIDEGDFYLECNEKEYTVTSSLGMNENKGFFYESINPGIKVKGVIHFDVPNNIVNSKKLILHYKDNEIILNSK